MRTVPTLSFEVRPSGDREDLPSGLCGDVHDMLDRAGIECSVGEHDGRLWIHVHSSDDDERRFAVRILRRAGYEVAIPVDRANIRT